MILSDNIVQLGFCEQCDCSVDPGLLAGLSVTGSSNVVPPKEPQGNQGRLKSEKKACLGPQE